MEICVCRLNGDVLIAVTCGDARFKAAAGRLVREYKIDNLACRKAGYCHLGAERILIADQQRRAIEEDIDIGGALVGEDNVTVEAAAVIEQVVPAPGSGALMGVLDTHVARAWPTAPRTTRAIVASRSLFIISIQRTYKFH